MAYRKLGRDNKHRRSMLATLTKQLIMNEKIVTTDCAIAISNWDSLLQNQIDCKGAYR